MTKLVFFWLLSLGVVASLTVGALTAFAQSRGDEFRSVVSGGDLGFRIKGRNPSGEPVGSLVIRVNDRWVEVAFGPTVRQVK